MFIALYGKCTWMYSNSHLGNKVLFIQGHICGFEDKLNVGYHGTVSHTGFYTGIFAGGGGKSISENPKYYCAKYTSKLKRG